MQNISDIIINEVSDGILIHNEGAFIKTNKAFREIFGYSILPTNSALEFAKMHFEEDELKKIESALTNTEANYSLIGKNTKGQRIHLKVRAKIFTLNRQKFRIAFFEDTTQNSKTKAKLINSSEGYHKLYDNILYPIMTFRREKQTYRFIHANKAWDKYTNGKDIYIGKEIEEAFTGEQYSQIKEKLDLAYIDKTSISYSINFKSVIHNKTIYLDCCATYSKPDLVILSFNNITNEKEKDRELNHSNYRYKNLYNNFIHPILTFTENNNTLYFTENNAAWDIYSQGADYRNQSLISIFNQKDQKAFIDQIINAYNTKTNVSIETSFISKIYKDKRYFKAILTHVPPNSIDLTFIDITDHKRNKLELIRNNIELKKLKFKLEKENTFLKKEVIEKNTINSIITANSKFKLLLSNIKQIAPTELSIFLNGETGTGKELVAKSIHELSNRSNRPYETINCASLPQHIVEIELFGHEKGAFKGANSRKIGKIEKAHTGTLFLEEIGSLSLETQAKLLRAIEDNKFEKIGSIQSQDCNIRLISSSIKDIEKNINDNSFRTDLYYKINAIPIEIPPLRDRRDDIPLLIKYFIDKFNITYNREIEPLTQEDANSLQTYKWPGNITELKNSIERAFLISNSNNLDIKALFGNKIISKNTTDNIYKKEIKHIVDVLNKCNWKVGGVDGAADALGLKRTTLITRMKKYGISKSSHKK